MGVMAWKIRTLVLSFSVAVVVGALGIRADIVPMAAAQVPTVCPPGQTFVISQGRCVAAQPAVRCPEGQEYDARSNRCVTPRSAVRCPEGQQFDARSNRCVTAGPPGLPSLPGVRGPQR